MSLAAAILLATVAIHRDRAAVRAFKHHQPCPYTKVEGCIVDHIVPLCAGGADRAANMQWQTRSAAKAKDRDERRLCADMRKRAASAR